MGNEIVNILQNLNAIDIAGILSIFPTVIISSRVVSSKITNYRIRKDSKVKDLKRVIIPEELKINDYSIQRDKMNEKYKDSIIEFSSLLTNKFSNDVLVNFYNNINRLKIRDNKAIFFSGTNGVYYPDKNDIVLAADKSIYHELFHMASSYYYRDEKQTISRIGFAQWQYKDNSVFDIGCGLNEGYTEALTKRYFGTNGAYAYEVLIAEHLEQIIGKELMENLYLKADLNGLINELSKYVPKNQISEFFTSFDIMSKYINSNAIKVVQEQIINIYNFLVTVYLVKKRRELYDGLISYDVFIDKYKLFIKPLCIKTKTFFGLNYDSLIEALDSVIDKNKIPKQNVK